MTDEPAAVEWIAGRVGEEPGHRLMVILAAPGCAWASATGGCTNCSFPRAFGTGRAVGAAEYEAQLEAVRAGIPAGARGPIELDLFVSGSFFNPNEVPDGAQERLLRGGARIPGVCRLLVETRPEYVTRERLERAVAAAAPLPLEVGIGLESASPALLGRIRKGFGWRELEEAARLVAASGAALLVYILLKPIDTGEREAIEDAVVSSEKVLALGKRLGVETRIALEPCFVAADTPLAGAFAAGRYRPPWLWSVVEVVRRVAPGGAMVVGLSDEGLEPQRAAHNCKRCSTRVRQALEAFNLSQDLTPLARLACSCQVQWSEELRQGRDTTGATRPTTS